MPRRPIPKRRRAKRRSGQFDQITGLAITGAKTTMIMGIGSAMAQSFHR